MTIKKLALQVKVAGMMGGMLKIATVELLQQPTEPELSDYTELVCPNDFKKTKYSPATYTCDCGFVASHWSKLLRVIKGTNKEVEIPKLSRDAETQTATVTQMPFAEFIKAGYADALPKEDAEKPISPLDDTSRETLNKLLVAHQMDKTAIIIKWNDTKEQKIALLTTSPSGKVVLRRIIPSNLIQFKKIGMSIDPTKITKEDLTEARTFLKQHVPKANDKTFEVYDYRIQALTIQATSGKIAKTASQKQQNMKELLQLARAKKGK